MKSRTGFFAAIAFLLALPIAALVQIVFGSGSDIVVHLVCGLGFALSAFAVFDYKLPRWITWIGFLATSGLAVTFILQGLGDLLQNNALQYLAYQVLGVWLEKLLADLFILWFVAMLLIDSRGKTRIFGFVAMTIIVFYEIYTYGMMFLGSTAAGSLKMLYFLAFLWFLLESRKKIYQTEKLPVKNQMNGIPL